MLKQRTSKVVAILTTFLTIRSFISAQPVPTTSANNNETLGNVNLTSGNLNSTSTNIAFPTPTPSRTIQQSSDSILVRDYGWVIALITLASVGILTLFIIQIFILAKVCGTRLAKGYHSLWLGELLLFGIFCCYLTLYAFLPYSSPATCGIIRFCVGVSYSLCFAVLVVKMVVIVSSRHGEVWCGFQFIMLFFVWGVQITIDVQWMITSPPGTTTVLPNSTSNSEPWGRCQTQFAAHVQSLVYVMFLIVFCAIFAVATSDLPANRREGVYIGTASVMIIGVWIIWLLLGFLMDDLTWNEPCIAFGLFFTATILLLVIFIPKMYQLSTMSVEELYGSDAFANCLVNPFPLRKNGSNKITSPNDRSSGERNGASTSTLEPTFQFNRELPRFTDSSQNNHDERKKSTDNLRTPLHLRHPGAPIYSLRPSSSNSILSDSNDADLDFFPSNRNSKSVPVGGFSYMYGQNPSTNLGASSSRLYIPRCRFQS